jgi:hypothetical protein
MSLVDKIANAIAEQEGWFSGMATALPRRNNNPGDLRASPWLTRPVVKGFVKFQSPAEGIAGLYHQIALNIARGYTLTRLIEAWAPPTENNTSAYLAAVTKAVGVDPSQPLWNYLTLGNNNE